MSTDKKLKKLEKIYKITSEWDDEILYEPQYPTFFSAMNQIARLEWARRKLLEFNIPTVEPFELDFSDENSSSDTPFNDISLSDMLEYGSYDIYECILCLNSFEEYLNVALEHLGWHFLCFCNEPTKFMEVASLLIGNKDDIESFEHEAEDACIIQANEVITKIYTTITASAILQKEPAAIKFMEYLPKWITKYYIDSYFYCEGKVINGYYTCANVLMLADSECYAGYEIQAISLPFRIMLVNHYANILIAKYPQLFTDMNGATIHG